MFVRYDTISFIQLVGPAPSGGPFSPYFAMILSMWDEHVPYKYFGKPEDKQSLTVLLHGFPCIK